MKLPGQTRYVFYRLQRFYTHNSNKFGTALTLGYLKHSEEASQEWIADVARERGLGLPVRLVKGYHQVTFRGMTYTTGHAAILCNWSEQDEEVVVQFQGNFAAIRDIIQYRHLGIAQSATATIVTVTIEAGTICVLQTQS